MYNDFMQITSRLLENLVLAGAIVMLGIGVLWGISAGSNAAKSIVILKNSQAIANGLKLFLNDQNRYPTALEFTDTNIMLQYFNVFPLPQITGGLCQQTFSYANASQKTYSLNFCLPKAVNGYAKGLNQITNPK